MEEGGLLQSVFLFFFSSRTLPVTKSLRTLLQLLSAALCFFDYLIIHTSFFSPLSSFFFFFFSLAEAKWGIC